MRKYHRNETVYLEIGPMSSESTFTLSSDTFD